MLPSPGDAPPARPVVVYSAMHGVGGDTVVRAARAGRLRARPVLVGRAVRARPRLPDRRLPEPRGAGGDGPVAGRRRRGRSPTWWSPTTPTPTGWRSRSPTPGRAAGGCCEATRSACCWPTPCSPTHRSCPRIGPRRPVLATSLVSSQQLGRMAAAAGIAYEETLTGFKWIARVAGPGPAPPVRLRGGARLLRGRPGRRQGRHQRPAGGRAPGRRARRLGHRAGRAARRAARGSTASTPPGRCRSAWTAPTGWPASPRPWPRCGPRRRPWSGPGGRRASRTWPTGARPGRLPAQRRGAPPPRRRPGHRPPERHRAQAQVLPRGGRARSPARSPTPAAEADRALDDIAAAMTELLGPPPETGGAGQAVPKRRSPASPRPGTM